MIVRFEAGVPRLEDLDNFRRLKIIVGPGDRPALQVVGRVEEDHVWLERDWLVLHGRPGDPDWARGFADMAAYAEKSGWVDAGGAIRAHVEDGPGEVETPHAS
jgi:hypothetical protein